jgi:hypothetical protein
MKPTGGGQFSIQQTGTDKIALERFGAEEAAILVLLQATARNKFGTDDPQELEKNAGVKSGQQDDIRLELSGVPIDWTRYAMWSLFRQVEKRNAERRPGSALAGASSGSHPIRSETNRTSATAASRP